MYEPDPRERDEKRQQDRTAAQHAQAAQDDQLVAVLATVEGRAVLYRLLAGGGLYRSSFAADPYLTAFNEGSRNAALKLLGDITRIAPDKYRAMQEENSHG
jgi:hypothetical protein